MSQIDIRAASIDSLSKHIGEALKVHAKKQGGVTALSEHSGVSRSTLNRLFSGKPVGLDSLLRVLRSLERYDVIQLLCEAPRLTPIEQWELEHGKRKPQKNPMKVPQHKQSTGFHVKMADPEQIIASLKKDRK